MGFHYSPTVRSNFITSIVAYDRVEAQRRMDPIGQDILNRSLEVDEKGYNVEAQYLFRANQFNLIAGSGYFDGERTRDAATRVTRGTTIVRSDASKTETDIWHTNIYIYSSVFFPINVTWTFGVSADFYHDSGLLDHSQLNQKVGLTWNPIPSTTLRVATFRVLKRSLIINQTIEPTNVAGFNQFFDDVNGTDSIRYGVALDQKLSSSLFGGIEVSKRDLKVPIAGPPTREEDQNEQLHRVYVYWTPSPFFSLSSEYQFEQFDREFMRGVLTPDRPNEIKTHRLPLGLNFFHPNGLFANLKATYIDQEIQFPNREGGTDEDTEKFWVMDLSVGYRLPKRWGILSITGKNLFDKKFKFQDTDLTGEPRIPLLQPERSIFARFTLSF